MIRKSVKNSLSDVLSIALRRREKAESDSDVATLDGSCSSECSTLVDFVINAPDVSATSPEYNAQLSINFLDDDNQAWTTPTSRDSGTVLQCSINSHSLFSNSRLSLLDEDECTWVMPRNRRSSSDRKKRTFFNSKSKNTKVTSGPCKSWHLLDPEERSWV